MSKIFFIFQFLEIFASKIGHFGPKPPPLYQQRVLILPRIPIKPEWNTTRSGIPRARSRPPPMAWCDYLRELGLEEAGERGAYPPHSARGKCGDGDEAENAKRKRTKTNKAEEGERKRKSKKKGNKRKRKERILIEVEKTVEEDGGEEDEEERQKMLLQVVDRVRNRMEEENDYQYEGVGNFAACQGYFAACRASPECASGALCRNRINEARCCRMQADSQCPTTEALGYTCRQKNPVNWCNVNADCATNAFRSHICCPTGCGYNVCLSNMKQPVTRRVLQMEARTRTLSPDCPSPFLIRIRCVVPRPSSWCLSARDCPTYSDAFPRRCCLTPCGYNVCMTKFGDDGWIIA